MLLTTGTLLGPYRIVAPLGAGGMGEVYRAHDARLNRDVALKILRPEFADDRDRLQRFAREAQALAALNHPNIAQIHGIEEAGPVVTTDDRSSGRPLQALVMEFVEGEDLSDRIARGALPFDEAIEIARGLADALEAAHEQGLVHRDLKPTNVKIRRDGTVKVLDFGLAKAMTPAGAVRGDALDSPTLASLGVTQAGIILGTAAYMSPEQARGKPIDKRADIWAFGLVLYEMLTGRAVYSGETVTDVLAAIVTREPDWAALPANVPPAVRYLLERCLLKDPRQRLRDIGEARVRLTDVEASPQTAAAAADSRIRTRRGIWVYLPWTIAGIAVIGAAAAWLLAPPPRAVTRRLELTLPTITDLAATLSPDGRHIAYRSRDRIALLELERAESRDLTVSSPSQRSVVFWAPDSTFVAYNDLSNKLWIIPVSGGTPRLVCDIPDTGQLLSATWHSNGHITFAVWRGNLYQVPAAGGRASVLAAIDPAKEIDFHNVIGLPDGRVMVATHLAPQAGSDEAYRAEVVGQQQRELAAGSGYNPVGYVDRGYVLMHRVDANTGLWAVPFDGRVPLRIEEAVIVAPGAAFASVATDGSLLYSLVGTSAQSRELVWVDRTGRIIGPLGAEHLDLASPELSPDERSVAFSARVGDDTDIWVKNLQSGHQTRVTADATGQGAPAWFPSGKRLAYSEAGAGIPVRIASSNADGSGGRQELAQGLSPSISPDGRYVTYTIDQRGQYHLRHSTITADGTVAAAAPLLHRTPEPSVHGVAFSPDGAYVAYTEQQPGGAVEVFVTRFPSGEGRWQVSSGGGRRPVWTSTELLFASGSGDGPKTMMAAPVRTRPSLVIGTPIKMFDVNPDFAISPRGASFDATSDGQRLVMIRLRRSADAPAPVRWILAQNWLNEVPAR